MEYAYHVYRCWDLWRKRSAGWEMMSKGEWDLLSAVAAMLVADGYEDQDVVDLAVRRVIGR